MNKFLPYPIAVVAVIIVGNLLVMAIRDGWFLTLVIPCILAAVFTFIGMKIIFR